jgi:hypothetical protein
MTAIRAAPLVFSISNRKDMQGDFKAMAGSDLRRESSA